MAIEIRRAAVIGAGTMGSGIAAQLANAGIPVLLLDIVPAGAADRNALAAGALAVVPSVCVSAAGAAGAGASCATTGAVASCAIVGAASAVVPSSPSISVRIVGVVISKPPLANCPI